MYPRVLALGGHHPHPCFWSSNRENRSCWLVSAGLVGLLRDFPSSATCAVAQSRSFLATARRPAFFLFASEFTSTDCSTTTDPSSYVRLEISAHLKIACWTAGASPRPLFNWWPNGEAAPNLRTLNFLSRSGLAPLSSTLI